MYYIWEGFLYLKKMRVYFICHMVFDINVLLWPCTWGILLSQEEVFYGMPFVFHFGKGISHEMPSPFLPFKLLTVQSWKLSDMISATNLNELACIEIIGWTKLASWADLVSMDRTGPPALARNRNEMDKPPLSTDLRRVQPQRKGYCRRRGNDKREKLWAKKEHLGSQLLPQLQKLHKGLMALVSLR